MSNKVTALVGGMLLVVAFLAGTMQGCGGSGNDVVATCNRGCDKAAMCDPELAAFVAQCKSQCSMQSPGGQPCTNEAAIVSAVNSCLNMTCETYLSCLDAVPDCQGGTGAGGTTGGAGSTGQGGAGGGPAANCATCTAANACCQAIPDLAGSCDLSATDCNALSGTNQASYIMGCQAIFTIARLMPTPPAACQ